MSADHGGREGFLSRWSRVKTDVRNGASEAASGAEASHANPPAVARVDSPAPELPPVAELNIDSDFSGFFHPKVDEDLRRSALRKLFSDPHFNVMDGLDTYVDDYSKTEPIPAAMLAGMRQAQRILEWAAETEEQAEARRLSLSPGADTSASAPLIAPVLVEGSTADAVVEVASTTPAVDAALDIKP